MDSLVIEIPSETPSKKNSRIVNRRTGRTFPSKKYTCWHDMATKWIGVNYGQVSVRGPVSVSIVFTHGTFARCDSDNKVSSIFDLLVDMRIIEDDEWKVVKEFSVRNLYDKGKPSCRIEIKSIE